MKSSKTNAVLSPEDSPAEHIQEISLVQLHAFKDHPFQVRDDDAMLEMAESVRQHGVLVPAIVRPSPEGGYELISGHRRHRASQLAGLTFLPAIVRDLDDDTATVIMVDSNLQRENLLPSERAFAYKMKLDAMKRQAGRPRKENGGQVGHHLSKQKTRDILADQTGDSARNIQRYIHLTQLIPPLLALTDARKIAFNPAYELSFLKPEEQTQLLDAMDSEQVTPSLSQAQQFKKLSQAGLLTADIMRTVLGQEKKSDLDRIILSYDTLRKYFPDHYTPKKMEDTILKLLDAWQRKRRRDMER